ncbi:MAG: sigma-70 family RNA polymerase sigma factor [Bacteroidia bacterium]|nr:sigma-70 family RNA polymerase sigma factor [Bacteroidales bacterium]NCD40987.1 sigma-70 family RNA polymerase sigma factor [Bacteroidia bacterium]MDD2322240.1 sigma-70 family RNA polymerase sigma factor [Bacteroidales bacterium]MDD3960281.1 sigma-70 family RNA polymerase sigma factor [Bacteroidales bacterium]MDY0284769.1 sigma-70 family RNA polymerase sigma factor [Bacteroidales bacterium]
MDQKQFYSTVLPLKGRLYRLALGYLKDPEDAEDAVQEIFVKLWAIRKALDKYRSIEALTVTMTKNYCLDQLKAKRRSEVSLDKVIAHAGGTSPEKSTVEKNLMHVILQILPQLPEQQKMVFCLRDMDGLELREIETLTGINYNNVRVLLSRARKTLREKIIKIQTYEYGQDSASN